MDTKSEAFMLNCAHLLRRCLGQLTVAELQHSMSELSATILQPILQSLVSVHSTFSIAGRSILTRQYAELLMCISRVLDRELSHEHLLYSTHWTHTRLLRTLNTQHTKHNTPTLNTQRTKHTHIQRTPHTPPTTHPHTHTQTHGPTP